MILITNRYNIIVHPINEGFEYGDMTRWYNGLLV